MGDGINLGLRDALEIRLFPFDQGREFLPEFEHEPILRWGQSNESLRSRNRAFPLLTRGAACHTLV